MSVYKYYSKNDQQSPLPVPQLEQQKKFLSLKDGDRETIYEAERALQDLILLPVLVN